MTELLRAVKRNQLAFELYDHPATHIYVASALTATGAVQCSVFARP